MPSSPRDYTIGGFVPKWTTELARRYRARMRPGRAPDPMFAVLSRCWKDLAALVVDFAVDAVRGARLWRGYEAWNLRHFGVALPVSGGEPGDGLSDARLRHFVWRALTVLDTEVTPAPDHPDVLGLVDASREFLAERLPALPAKAHYDAFFNGPQDHGSAVKRKLIALGTDSYFFRFLSAEYMAAEAGRASADDPMANAILWMDDFLCQHCTIWSGMGAIDLLAEILDLPEARRADIRHWNERHLASYRIDEVTLDAVDGEIMRVTSLAGDRPYKVRCADRPSAMRPGVVVYGLLAPWDEAWIWSGAQIILGSGRTGEKTGRELTEVMKREPGAALCRCWPEYRARVLDMFASLRAGMTAFRDQRDLVIYPDWDALEADQQIFMDEQRSIQGNRAKQGRPPAQTKADFENAFPRKALRDDQAGESVDAVTSFFNPEEGVEELSGYHELCAALEKRGHALSRDEHDGLLEFIQSPAISPAFVKRLLLDFPAEALYRLFGIPPESPPPYALDWLLRCWKGEYHRPRYPSVSVV